MLEQRRVARGEVLLLGQVAEGRREAIGTVLVRHAAGLPQGVLESLGQRLEALAALDHLGVLLSGDTVT